MGILRAILGQSWSLFGTAARASHRRFPSPPAGGWDSADSAYTAPSRHITTWSGNLGAIVGHDGPDLTERSLARFWYSARVGLFCGSFLAHFGLDVSFLVLFVGSSC